VHVPERLVFRHGRAHNKSGAHQRSCCAVMYVAARATGHMTRRDKFRVRLMTACGPTRPSRGVWPWSAERPKPDIDEPWSTLGTQRFQPLDTIRSFLKLKLTSYARAGNRAGFFRARSFRRHGRTASEGRAAARPHSSVRSGGTARKSPKASAPRSRACWRASSEGRDSGSGASEYLRTGPRAWASNLAPWVLRAE
jgi:hypothetical protein